MQTNKTKKGILGGRLKAKKHNISAVKKAVEICGSRRVLARRLSVSQQTIEQWLIGTNCISGERAKSIEYVTQGKVTRQMLRPDLWEKMEEYYDEVDEG